MIGLASVLLMASHGRIAGISGIALGMFPPWRGNTAAGRIAFVAGLIAAPALYAAFTGAWAPMTIAGTPALLIIAGVLAGFGSILGNGCTSGHGICGLARLSKRSFVAVGVFMATAIVTVFVMRHLLGA
jgi:uncharacterized protein